MLYLECPIGVFDAGIGSYQAVEKLRRLFPRQDLVYLADRASFPYGAKSELELTACVESGVELLAREGCRTVLLASNAPSVMVLEQLRPRLNVPVFGVYPPIARALQLSRSGGVAVLGVASMIHSAQMCAYVRAQAGRAHVRLVNASSLVQKVEDGSFLSDRPGTRKAVREFLHRLREEVPGLDVGTLSSTHLPWLLPYLEEAAPEVRWLDPLDEALRSLEPFCCEGSGSTVCLVTESPQNPYSEFQQILRRLNLNLTARLVTRPS